jgi:hypothetical protein
VARGAVRVLWFAPADRVTKLRVVLRAVLGRARSAYLYSPVSWQRVAKVSIPIVIQSSEEMLVYNESRAVEEVAGLAVVWPAR